MSEALQQRVRAHDQYQIEFKLDYELLPSVQTRYKITTYIFVPQSLGIHESTYPSAEFYRDIQNYVRLKTPVFALCDLSYSPASPLQHIEQLLHASPSLSGYVRVSRLGDSFKFLRAILKSSLRRHLRRLKAVCTKQTDAVERLHKVTTLINELIEQTRVIVSQYRSYGKKLERSQVGAQLFQSYRLTDESISLVVEEGLVDAFRLVHKYLQGEAQAELEKKISQEVENEIAYRKLAHEDSLLRPTGDNEAFLFRSSVLKKFTSSVLYLSLSVKREGTAIEQFLFACAAGLSMVFATVVAFYFQYRYGQLTYPFFIALVVGYMFKDRIKELARVFFAQHLSNLLYDRRTVVKTLDGQHSLGHLREKVTFIAEDKVPPHILAHRNRNLITPLGNEGQEEHVICYSKEVVLRADAFKHIYTSGPEITGLTDIMRLDVRPYLRKMDDPVAHWFYLNDGALHTAQAAKVYHLNFVSVYTVGNQQESENVERTRVVLTRNGIKRVERFP